MSISNSKKIPWYQSEKEWYTRHNIETNVVLRLSEKVDTALELIWRKLGYEFLDDYVNEVIKQNISSEMGGCMDLEVEQIQEIEEKMILLDKDKEG